MADTHSIETLALDSLADDALLASVRRLTARSNTTLADLLAYLGEVESRGIHRERACASLYTFCQYELRMSEDAAYRRAKAARRVRKFPELHPMIARGELHLTGLLMIGPHLGGERHAEILARARFRSKRELCRLLAVIDPKPEVPALIEPLGPAGSGRATHAALVQALAGPGRELPPGQQPGDWLESGAGEARDAELGEDRDAEAGDAGDAELGEARDAEPGDAGGFERPVQYKVQFTASQEYVDLVQEAFDLLGHPQPGLPCGVGHGLIGSRRSRRRRRSQPRVFAPAIRSVPPGV
jgi:hypothetical protein